MTTSATHRRASLFARIITSAALDAADHGAHLAHIAIDQHGDREHPTLHLQVAGINPFAVDVLADHHGLDPAPLPADRVVYGRDGITTIAGERVILRVYCAQPAQVTA
jgi:hypothetical protein